MSRASRASHDKPEKPDLELVLDHYGATDFNPSLTKQKIRCISGVHGDSHPSMTVDVDKGLVKCFSCDLAGDAYSIIMWKENLGFSASVEIANEREWLSGQAVPRSPSLGGGRKRVGLFSRSRTDDGDDQGVPPGVRRRPRIGS